jgi:hypothetical protein
MLQELSMQDRQRPHRYDKLVGNEIHRIRQRQLLTSAASATKIWLLLGL